MNRQILLEIAPFLALAALALLALVVLTRVSRGQLDWSQLAKLHGDERGAVQSLSFVLTVPIYVMILLFIVQLSQLTVAKVVVEYAAFAAARSAVVWIPAALGPAGEGPNQLVNLQQVGDEQDSNGMRFTVYRVSPGSPKYQRIWYAAVASSLSIAPSRNVGAKLPAEAEAALASLERAYLAAAPGQSTNPQIPTRLRNKLAYTWNNTRLEITLRHRASEPPLQMYDLPPDRLEFAPGEVGWHEQVIVKVEHDFALLPGPGRFLARPAGGSGSNSASGTSGVTDRISSQIQRQGNVHVYSLSARATLHTEGEKPLILYTQQDVGPLRLPPQAGTALAAPRSPQRSSLSLAVDDDSWSQLPWPPHPNALDETRCAVPADLEHQP